MLSGWTFAVNDIQRMYVESRCNVLISRAGFDTFGFVCPRTPTCLPFAYSHAILSLSLLTASPQQLHALELYDPLLTFPKRTEPDPLDEEEPEAAGSIIKTRQRGSPSTGDKRRNTGERSEKRKKLRRALSSGVHGTGGSGKAEEKLDEGPGGVTDVRDGDGEDVDGDEPVLVEES